MNDKKQYQLREYNGGLVFEMEDGSSTVAQQNFNSYNGEGFEMIYFGPDELCANGHDHFETIEALEKAMKEIAPINHWKAK